MLIEHIFQALEYGIFVIFNLKAVILARTIKSVYSAEKRKIDSPLLNLSFQF
jgi:hypothetical protein